MSKTVVAKINNEVNLKIIMEWYTKNHIEFEVIENNSIPMGVDECNSTPNTPKTTKESKSNDTFPTLGDKADEIVGVITRYGKFVRNWEVGVDGKVGGFTTKGVRYATKMAITESGAKWNADKKAYEFPKVADAKAFMKEQIARMKELEKKKIGKALVK